MKTDQDLETRLEAMFTAQVSALRVPSREWSDVTDRRAPGASRRRRSSAALAVASFAAVLAVVAVALRSGPGEDVRTDRPAAPATAASPSSAAPFKVETQQVSLAARALLIDAAGTTFTAAPPLEVHGDPGTADEYTTLELTWSEHGVEMRLNVYFKSDGREWWSDEIRTYDGAEQGEWITYEGDFFRSRLGTPFVGDLDVSAEDHGVTGRLRLPGLRLEAFRRPSACDKAGAPYALQPATNPVTVPAEANGHDLSVTLLDAATCQAVPNPGDYEFRWVAEPSGIVKHSTGEPRVDLQPLAAGTTSLHVTAVDRRSGEVVGKTTVSVTVAGDP